jgi:hypothetical protein
MGEAFSAPSPDQLIAAKSKRGFVERVEALAPNYDYR